MYLLIILVLRSSWLAVDKYGKFDNFISTEYHGDVTCTSTQVRPHRWDLYSKLLLIFKRSSAYVGVVGIAAMKEKHGGKLMPFYE